jgi:chaperonin GroES
MSHIDDRYRTITGVAPERHSGPAPEERRRLWIIRPLHDRILVRRLEDRNEWVMMGNVLGPRGKQQTLCEVVAVGPGKRDEESGVRIPLTVKKGDKVLIGPYSDLEMDDLVICQEADVRVVVDA